MAAKLSFTADFRRIAPTSFGEKVGIPLGWVVVNHGHIPDKADRRQVHGEWFEIKSVHAKIYRMLRFSPRLAKGSAGEPGSIVLDWVGWIDLHDRGEDVDGSISLTLSPVPWWGRPWAYLKHPDPAVRLSGWLGWLSVILGALSLVLTVYTLVQASWAD